MSNFRYIVTRAAQLKKGDKFNVDYRSPKEEDLATVEDIEVLKNLFDEEELNVKYSVRGVTDFDIFPKSKLLAILARPDTK